MTHLSDTDQAPYSAPVNTGGAAFPGGQFEPQYGGSNDREPWNHGMTLHDYVAAKATQNPLICTGLAPEWQIKAWFGDTACITKAQIMAAQAFEYATAFIAAREVRK